MRRKTAFLLSTLALPVTPGPLTPQRDPPLLIETPSVVSPITATTTVSRSVGTSAPSTAIATVSDPRLHTVDEPTADNPDRIHDNSHAAQLRDPSRNDTSRIALAGFKQYHIVDAVISALTNPLPYGEDGESDQPDTDFEEKAMQ